MENSLRTPVLLLTFNRLENTEKVFSEIRKAKPKQLFIASDGPREDKEGEREIVEGIRKYLLKNIDWPCKVKTLFRKKNLGCKYAVSGAIDWFFENVEQGIILEDDCLPSQSFFRFCQEMLERYKNERKIMSISGYNYLNGADIKESYYFSRYFECWGWATWKDRWDLCDLELKQYEKLKKDGTLKRYFNSLVEKKLYIKRFEDNLKRCGNSWAYPFLWSHFLYSSYSITPKDSLIVNLGTGGEQSTHTKFNKIDNEYFKTTTTELSFPLVHPKTISKNKSLTRKYLAKEIKRVVLKSIYSFLGNGKDK